MIKSLILKFLSIDSICSFIALCIAKILKYASSKRGEAWEKSKSIIRKINIWTSLFIQVYEDDNLTEDEENLIAEAIKKETSIEKIIEIIKK